MSMRLLIIGALRLTMLWRHRPHYWSPCSCIEKAVKTKCEKVAYGQDSSNEFLPNWSHPPSSSNSIKDCDVACLQIYAVSFISFIKEETLFSSKKKILWGRFLTPILYGFSRTQVVGRTHPGTESSRQLHSNALWEDDNVQACAVITQHLPGYKLLWQVRNSHSEPAKRL